MSTGARDELKGLIEASEPMRQILTDLENEPLRLLCAICREHAETGRPVPDHRLPLFNYFAEASLRALVAAGMLSIMNGSSSIYEYEPTEAGNALHKRLAQEGSCRP